MTGAIAVIAPSGPYPPERFAEGVQLARDAGFELDLFPEMLRPWRYLAAPDEVRLAQLEEALRSRRHEAVWIARGGYGLSRILPRLSLAGGVPKRVIGFSDATALFAVLWKAGWRDLIHGPVVNSLPITSAESQAATWQALRGRPAGLDGEVWVPGEASGPVLGGNLCMLASLCGTAAQVSAAGAILVLEDVAEPPYRIDRMLRQLRAAGVLDGVAALGFGEFVQCRPPEGADWTVRDVLLDCTADLGVPLIGNLPIGHGARNVPFTWGTRMRLKGDALLPDTQHGG